MESEVSEKHLEEAGGAVRDEFRESSRIRRLRSRHVLSLGQVERHGLYRLSVGPAADFDWSWEGSLAYRPLDPHEAESDDAGALVWSGEVVEVDVVRGFLFVTIARENVAEDELLGTFWVRPFPFLLPLKRLLLDADGAALRPRVRENLARTLDAAGELLDGDHDDDPALPLLQDAWRRTWGILWGPPGTGKTRTIGEQVALTLAETDERVLVVSTTNKASDAVALSIGRALRRQGDASRLEDVIRCGRGGDLPAFADEGFAELLSGAESEARARLAELERTLRRNTDSNERARLRAQMDACRRTIRDGSIRAFTDPSRRVVVTTAHNAIALLTRDPIGAILEDDGDPLFTTLILDEASQVSRVATAALALYGDRRVLLVGDPRQLAPISRLSRIMPPERSRWIASSALSGLTSTERPGVCFLDRQYRMHAEIRQAVSDFAYGGRLRDAPVVTQRPPLTGDVLADAPRAIWYVLDEETTNVQAMRAERGPGYRSWIRRLTLTVLEKLFAASPQMATGPGLFLTPFVAQARQVDELLVRNDRTGWIASTVHAQQGAEADFVVFDAVNAGSHVWPTDEWLRLVNVAISRARELVVVIASRQEMSEPYLLPLARCLAPRTLAWRGSRYFWQEAEAARRVEPPRAADADPHRLGVQLEARRALRPLLSREQERLCHQRLDGGPRLVRGVAGSGKTVILAHWLAQVAGRLHDRTDARIWVVFANRSLRALIEETTEEAWSATHRDPFPWHRVGTWHVKDLLTDLMEREELGPATFGFDYEAGAELLLRHFATATGKRTLEPLCDALFVDEAQDLGHATLDLLARLVRPGTERPGERNMIVFYDNAQNLYRRGAPTWSDLGLHMRGRSTVLKESFRSTLPISEYALNVLYRFDPPVDDVDHDELVDRGLLHRTCRNGRPWWQVRYTEIDGPAPRLRRFVDREAELRGLATHLTRWIAEEGVRPADIRVLHLGEDVGQDLVRILEPALAPVGARVLLQRSQSFTREPDVVVVTTPHSFKGYDAEIIVVAAADRFWAQGAGILAQSLYVAMTRARSVLELYALDRPRDADGRLIVDVLATGLEDLAAPDEVHPLSLDRDDADDLARQLGDGHRAWLRSLIARFIVHREPVLDPTGEVRAHPLFTVQVADRTLVCYGDEPAPDLERAALEDAGIEVLGVGDEP